ncbi:hypothetical protein EDC01DRAFT_263035 [Geopyxis carbonaria]|nr:hypothetical protein EDC01DRAFT_263035 [Geopyxis carbonaria]
MPGHESRIRRSVGSAGARSEPVRGGQGGGSVGGTDVSVGGGSGSTDTSPYTSPYLSIPHNQLHKFRVRVRIRQCSSPPLLRALYFCPSLPLRILCPRRTVETPAPEKGTNPLAREEARYHQPSLPAFANVPTFANPHPQRQVHRRQPTALTLPGIPSSQDFQAVQQAVQATHARHQP